MQVRVYDGQSASYGPSTLQQAVAVQANHLRVGVFGVHFFVYEHLKGVLQRLLEHTVTVELNGDQLHTRTQWHGSTYKHAHAQSDTRTRAGVH